MADETMSRDGLRPAVEAIMNGAWREPGFCVPNGDTYPHQWLWDSCFHAIVWSALGDERAVVELRNVMAGQEPSGFVPHLTYWNDPDHHRTFWGRSKTSIITQPPMYGHAARRLAADGRQLDDATLASIGRALSWLFRGRARTPAGLIPIHHPWESGCDDSPRWDDYRNPESTWREVKGDLVAELRTGGDSLPDHRFRPGSVGFNALVAWNTQEYLELGDVPYRGELEAAVDDLVAALRRRWDADHLTWIDDGPPSGRIRTLDALLVALVDPKQAAFDQLLDDGSFGSRFGPRGVHVAEPMYEPDVYWRGPTWPQLSFLFVVAAERAGHADLAAELGRRLVAGATASGFAEYWHPDSGRGLGAIPQTWAALAFVVAD